MKFLLLRKKKKKEKGKRKKEKENREEENCSEDQRERAVRARSARDVRADEKNEAGPKVPAPALVLGKTSVLSIVSGAVGTVL